MHEQKAHILVLDDQPSVLDVLGQHLESLGYEYTLCASSEEALDLLERIPFSLLLADVGIPGMSGIEVARRAKSFVDDLAVIVMTGMAEVNNAIDAMRAGADDYVLKPFELDEITISIANALEKRRLIIRNREYEAELEQEIKDATCELEKANLALGATQEYLNRLIDSTVDAIITIDMDEIVTFANRGAQRMLGHSESELVGASIGKLYVGGIEEARYIRRVLRMDEPLQNYETELHHANGTRVPVSVSVSLVPDESGGVASTLAICKDITDQKRLEAELKEMSIRDGLTGLYNLRHFYERLQGEIERAKRQNHELSMLLIDVDRFKSYNDAHGHLEGDGVLIEVARVINECTREHVDLGFRYGGDEFTILLPEAPEATARQIAERIRASFEAKRFDLLTLSIGLMTHQEGYSDRHFVQFTDSMMYDAKRSGGNRVYIYQSETAESKTAESETAEPETAEPETSRDPS